MRCLPCVGSQWSSHMKRTNILLWTIVILFVGLAFWMITTGKLDALSTMSINRFWNSLENMIRPIFHR